MLCNATNTRPVSEQRAGGSRTRSSYIITTLRLQSIQQQQIKLPTELTDKKWPSRPIHRRLVSGRRLTGRRPQVAPTSSTKQLVHHFVASVSSAAAERLERHEAPARLRWELVVKLVTLAIGLEPLGDKATASRRARDTRQALCGRLLSADYHFGPPNGNRSPVMNATALLCAPPTSCRSQRPGSASDGLAGRLVVGETGAGQPSWALARAQVHAPGGRARAASSPKRPADRPLGAWAALSLQTHGRRPVVGPAGAADLADLADPTAARDDLQQTASRRSDKLSPRTGPNAPKPQIRSTSRVPAT